MIDWSAPTPSTENNLKISAITALRRTKGTLEYLKGEFSNQVIEAICCGNNYIVYKFLTRKQLYWLERQEVIVITENSGYRVYIV